MCDQPYPGSDMDRDWEPPANMRCHICNIPLVEAPAQDDWDKQILAKAQLSKGKCSSQHIYSATNQAQQNSK